MPTLEFQTPHFDDLEFGMRESLRKTVESEDVVGFLSVPKVNAPAS